MRNQWDSQQQFSKIIGYSDESRPTEDIHGVEAISEVDHSCELPDNFGYTEVKWRRSKSKFLSKEYRFRNRWLDQFKRIKIYVIAPLEIIDRTASDVQVASALALLDPSSWHYCLELENNDLYFDNADFGKWRKRQRDLVEKSTNRKLNSAENVRRLVGRSQVLFSEILDHMPYTVASGEILWDKKTYSIPASDLIKPPSAKVVYDAGHEFDIPILETSRLDVSERLRPYKMYFRLGDCSPGSVNEQDSKLNDLIQLADFSAGYARYLYENINLRSTLPVLFEKVYVNGKAMI